MKICHRCDKESNDLKCYISKFPVERRWLCKQCIDEIIKALRDRDADKQWWPYEAGSNVKS